MKNRETGAGLLRTCISSLEEQESKFYEID